MRKPNWKRQGLKRPITDKELRERREKRDLELFLQRTNLPPELKEFVAKNPAFIEP